MLPYTLCFQYLAFYDQSLIESPLPDIAAIMTSGFATSHLVRMSCLQTHDDCAVRPLSYVARLGCPHNTPMSKLFQTGHALCNNNVYKHSCCATRTTICSVAVSIFLNMTNSTHVMPRPQFTYHGVHALTEELRLNLSSCTSCLLVQYCVSCSYGIAYHTFIWHTIPEHQKPLP